MLTYRYELEKNRGATGYGVCVPDPEIILEEALAILETRPRDSFLRARVLKELLALSPKRVAELAKRAGETPGAVFYDWRDLTGAENENFLPNRPFPLAPSRDERRKIDAAWIDFWNANIFERSLSPAPKIPPPYAEAEIAEELVARKRSRQIWFSEWEKFKKREIAPVARPNPREIFERARDALTRADILAGPEMRHEASLSPIALLRSWRARFGVSFGVNAHLVRGETYAYGRGLSLAQARASCHMEIVERASAYAEIMEGGERGAGMVARRKKPLFLRRATWRQLREEGHEALDPALFSSAPEFSRSAEIHWLEGVTGLGRVVLVPARLVFMFLNPDEDDATYAPDSAGLASGATLEEARLAALCELIERDALVCTPYLADRGFIPDSRDPLLRELLRDYRLRNIRVVCQEITTEIGLPAYLCYVRGKDGVAVQAAAAGFSGKHALLAALTETPWPYVWAKPAPFGKASAPAPANLPIKFIEDLPDYSLPSTAANLALLENVLGARGREPVYVDISRDDLEFPVTRALIPGLERGWSLDKDTPPSLRLFAAARELGIL